MCEILLWLPKVFLEIVSLILFIIHLFIELQFYSTVFFFFFFNTLLYNDCLKNKISRRKVLSTQRKTVFLVQLESINTPKSEEILLFQLAGLLL